VPFPGGNYLRIELYRDESLVTTEAKLARDAQLHPRTRPGRTLIFVLEVR
jgi:hypothetical protein